ncbi:hypothetical protein [Mycolicibacterium sphagni]|uniref:hypothetical protein n=1 Tax=Mycolicibacterium sphagni TaxID=1786 RepID=UPI0021F2F2CE|nr:hypothetical protein [Mycolicibacterium sphagni]MCV7175108.1 hypothetical protein [Mycolicibacterium sphagni]
MTIETLEVAAARRALTEALADQDRRTIILKEPLTYEKGNGKSYFRDLALTAMGDADGGVRERLRRHEIDVIRTADYPYQLDDVVHVLPRWMRDQLSEIASVARPYLNFVHSQQIPPGTDAINIPKVTGPIDPDSADTYARALVCSIAGEQTVARGTIAKRVDLDEVLFKDIAASYYMNQDIQAIGGTGADQLLGVSNTPGIPKLSADLSDSSREYAKTIYKRIAVGIQGVHTTRYLPPRLMMMHPRRWAFFTALKLTSSFLPDDAEQEFGDAATLLLGSLQGLPVATDPNMTLDGKDFIHILRPSDLYLFESDVRARVVSSDTDGGWGEDTNPTFQIHGRTAFTAGRIPSSVCEISDLAAPDFEAITREMAEVAS